jgi:hypothetical protein
MRDKVIGKKNKRERVGFVGHIPVIKGSFFVSMSSF